MREGKEGVSLLSRWKGDVMTYDTVVGLMQQGGLTAFLLMLWWLERRDRLAAEQRERERFEAHVFDGMGGGSENGTIAT